MKNFFTSSFNCLSWYWSLPVRYTIIFVATMANTLEYALRDNMSISMVAMTGMSKSSHNDLIVNSSTSTSSPSSSLGSSILINATHSSMNQSNNNHEYIFDWSPRTQGMILGSFYYGYIISHLCGGQVCAWLGPRISVAISILFSCIFTLTIPFAAFQGPIYLAFIRAALGTSQGLLTPSLYALFSKWIPSNERSTSLALLVVGGNLGSLITMLASGYLCEYGFAGGWPSVYYVHAIVASICLIIWIYTARNEPEQHSGISEVELKMIKENIHCKERDEENEFENDKIPWTGILLSPAIWSIGIAKFAGKWGFITWETQLPTYLARALHMNMEQNSVVNALRYMSMSISLLVAGFISDRIDKKKLLSKTVSRKLFESIALIGPAIMTFIIPFTNGNIPLIISALITSMILYGFCAGGDNPMVVDISPQNSGAIYGFTAGLSSFPGPLAPYFVGYVLELGNGDPSAWNYVFYSCSMFYLIGAIFFMIFGTSKEQNLDKSSSNQLSSVKCKSGTDDFGEMSQRK